MRDSSRHDVLLTGFRGTASELLVKRADCKSLILPNDKGLDGQILLAELERQDYGYVFSFGQKPNIRDKVYLETTARNGDSCFHTDFAHGKLQAALRAQGVTVRISDFAGTSFCNALYWNGLEYLRNRELSTKMLFVHIPFLRNVTAVEDFFERILKGIAGYAQTSTCLRNATERNGET